MLSFEVSRLFEALRFFKKLEISVDPQRVRVQVELDEELEKEFRFQEKLSGMLADLSREEWRKQLLRSFSEDFARSASFFLGDLFSNLSNLYRVYLVRNRVIQCLREKPAFIYFGSIISIEAESERVINDLCGELDIVFRKTVEMGEVMWRGRGEGVDIKVRILGG